MANDGPKIGGAGAWLGIESAEVGIDVVASRGYRYTWTPAAGKPGPTLCAVCATRAQRGILRGDLDPRLEDRGPGQLRARRLGAGEAIVCGFCGEAIR